jgi:hypothetical protein
MAWHKGRGILFGGVHDVEASEEGMDSEFFNQLFAWNIERNRFMPLGLRKPRQQKKSAVEPRGGRRGRAQANEDELLRQLAALETGASLDDADDIELIKKEEEQDADKPAREMPVTMEPPHMRFNAQLAIQDDVLYIYGGTFEKGDREFTFDDLYAIDLGKLDGCKEIFSRAVEDWIVSDNDVDLGIRLANYHLRSPMMRTTRTTMKKTMRMKMRTTKKIQPSIYTQPASERRSKTRFLSLHRRLPQSHPLLLKRMRPRLWPRL